MNFSLALNVIFKIQILVDNYEILIRISPSFLSESINISLNRYYSGNSISSQDYLVIIIWRILFPILIDTVVSDNSLNKQSMLLPLFVYSLYKIIVNVEKIRVIKAHDSIIKIIEDMNWSGIYKRMRNVNFYSKFFSAVSNMEAFSERQKSSECIYYSTFTAVCLFYLSFVFCLFVFSSRNQKETWLKEKLWIKTN